MRMKKFFTMLLGLVLPLSFSACGKNKGPAIDSISFDKSTLVMEVGDTYTLSVISSPTAEIQLDYLSSNTGVAIVDSVGKITALDAGKTTITGKYKNLTTYCEVTVNQKEPEIEPVNGFVPFPRGGLLGGVNGTYNPVTVTAIGDDTVKFEGKGGLSWPDTENNPEPDCMGGYYKEKLDLDGLKITWQLNQDMQDWNGDYWYFIALEDREQLFNHWNGSDPTKTVFFMIGFQDSKVVLKAHYRDVMELGEAWSFLGDGQGVMGNKFTKITIEFNWTPGGLEVYMGGQLQIFSNIKSPYIVQALDFYKDGKAYLMAGAHIGNPENQYTGTYAFSLGVSKEKTEFVDIQSLAFASQTDTMKVNQTKTFSVTAEPATSEIKFITYRSSNTGVLTIDNQGNARAIATGSSTVTAMTQGKRATCNVTIEPADINSSSIELNKTSLDLRVNESIELVATILPIDATDKTVTWSILENKTNVTLVVNSIDSSKATVTGVSVGECVVQAQCGEQTSTCAISIKQSLNGFGAFIPGGLVNNTSYQEVTMSTVDYSPNDRVKFSGKGGTNWGDTTKNPSTMGGFSLDKLDLDGVNILYSVNEWIQSGEHWYYIALTNGPKDQLFGNNAQSAGTLFFMFSYDAGNIVLNAHYVGAGYGWTQIGVSQTIPAVGGEYNFNLRKVNGGYSVYAKNAEQSTYTLLSFGGTSVISDTIMNTLFGSQQQGYLQAGAYVATYSGVWSFVLGVGNPIKNN